MKKISKKTSAIIWSIMYLLVVALSIVCVTTYFHKLYYSFYYVDGKSMYPTLNINEKGNLNKDFGIIDAHPSIFSHLVRYDIVVAHYPEDYNENGKLKDNATSKIKRVIGFPGETIVTFERGFAIYTDGHTPSGEEAYEAESYYVDGEKYDLSTLPYTPNNTSSLKKVSYYLNRAGENDSEEDQYFVLGDNWGNSNDSTNTSVGPVKRSMLTGILIAIQGQCDIDNNGEAVNLRYTTPKYYKL